MLEKLFGGMLILGGVFLIGIIPYAIIRNPEMQMRDGTVARMSAKSFLKPLALTFYALGGFLIYNGWKLSNPSKLNY